MRDWKIFDHTERNDMADNTGLPFSTHDEGVNYPNIAREIVYRYIMTNSSHVNLARLGFNKDGVYIVWFAKTLKNWKALVSTHIPDGRYYEITYNGDKDVAYLDVYTKQENIEVPFEDIQLLGDGVPFFKKVRIPRDFEPTDDPI